MTRGRPKSPAMTSLSDQDFIADYTAEGPTAMADRLGVTLSTIKSRALHLRGKGVHIPPRPTGGEGVNAANANIIANNNPAQHDVRLTAEVEDGIVVIFSDAHYWPGPPSTAHRGLIKLIRELEPKIVICNGDAIDLAAISRHPPIGWESQPTVKQEVEATQDRLHEIMGASTARTRHIWNLGNHDARFETKLATVAPEFADMNGIHLYDHFPLWDRAWSTWINDDVVVKHRFKGGDHATWNNTMKAGKTMVTGHLHSAQVRPFTDYNGTRFGVDTGCLATPFGRQFTNYTEDNPRNWISAFGVLTFMKGKLLWPELVTVWDENTIQFRGKLINV